MRDFQKSKVYAWEQLHVKNGPRVAFENVQAIVDYVWANEGYQYPPKVELLHKNNKKAAAKANRMHVLIPEYGASTRTILHELAHSMTAHFDGQTHMHDENFVGMAMKLYSKYLNLPLPVLMYTANMCGVKFNQFVKASFLD